MKGILISLVIMGYVMLSLYKRFKRTIADNAQSATDDVYDNQQVYEETDFEHEEPAPAPANPYFSYEYEAPAAKPTAKPQPQPVVAQQPQTQSAAGWNGFDLRQAVIYQTVLNNHYIEEINQ